MGLHDFWFLRFPNSHNQICWLSLIPLPFLMWFKMFDCAFTFQGTNLFCDCPVYFQILFCFSAHARPLRVSMVPATHLWSLLRSEFPLCSFKAKRHLRVSFLLGDCPFCSRSQQVASFLAASQCQEIKLSLSISPPSGQGKTSRPLVSPHHVQEEPEPLPLEYLLIPWYSWISWCLAHRCSGTRFILQWSQSRVLKWRQSKTCSRCSVPSNSGRWPLLTVSLHGGQVPGIAGHMDN